MTATGTPRLLAMLPGLMPHSAAAEYGLAVATGMRSPVALALFAASCAAAVLMAFGTVVRRSVEDAQSARHAVALLHEATWRCKALRVRALREACLCRSRRDLPADSAGVQAMVNASAQAVSPNAQACMSGASVPMAGSSPAGDLVQGQAQH